MTAETEEERHLWRHAVLAAGFDVLLANLAVTFALALYGAVRQEPAPLRYLWVFLAAAVVAVIGYHLRADRVEMLSPGEKLTGRVLALRGKVWINPFQQSRGLLFAMVMVSFVMASHAWGRTWTGGVVTTTELLLGTVVVVLLVSGALAVGGGSREAIVWLCVYHLLIAALRYRALGGLGMPWEFTRDPAALRIVLAAGCLALAFWYRPRRLS